MDAAAGLARIDAATPAAASPPHASPDAVSPTAAVPPAASPATDTPLAGAVPAGAAQADPAAPRATTRPRVSPDRPARAEVTVSTKNAAFQSWVAGFRSRALAQGIAGRTFDAAFAGVRYNDEVIARDRNQTEFSTAIWDYLDRAVSDMRIENGRAALARHAGLLDRIEAEFGVEKEIVTAIWGMESAYGSFRGDTPIVEALATLAHDGRRGAFFETQLVAALQIVQAGDVAPAAMTGSWAGAMGHTQFIPTSYLSYAVDFGRDGQRDIWSDDPADALASTAAYLDRFGWTHGQPWGVEVRLPDGFDYTQASRSVEKLPSDWARLGVVRPDGAPVPDHAPASLLLPAGARGPAFLIFPNFKVIERYNAANAYVIAVGHLGDRLAGAGPLQADWPRDDRALSFAERKEMQRRLTAQGYDTRGIDGRVGPRTMAAIRAFQSDTNRVPDGYASLALLEALR
ncbi:lytic murein transglycosylase [Mesobaculum littorinae]|uniref:Lytic murein transglycosylase n=1 Tax=Mesobaculum littorinae TaxID=2486419 RepID=A0A438AK85_9RHOB|nr:lytic murein transglycosylase [Mesobaculum littorinae]